MHDLSHKLCIIVDFSLCADIDWDPYIRGVQRQNIEPRHWRQVEPKLSYTQGNVNVFYMKGTFGDISYTRSATFTLVIYPVPVQYPGYVFSVKLMYEEYHLDCLCRRVYLFGCKLWLYFVGLKIWWTNCNKYKYRRYLLYTK